MIVFPWKQSGHGFTHLVGSPLNFTCVSNCSWQGCNRVHLWPGEIYYAFSVELSAFFFPFLLFPVETALFVTGHPTSLKLTREVAIFQLLVYGWQAFLSLLFCGIGWCYFALVESSSEDGTMSKAMIA